MATAMKVKLTREIAKPSAPMAGTIAKSSTRQNPEEVARAPGASPPGRHEHCPPLEGVEVVRGELVLDFHRHAPSDVLLHREEAQLTTRLIRRLGT